jgi:hypothetical protein
MSTEYPVRTLVDMAAIPEDRLPDFLTELPILLSHVRAAVQMQRMMWDVADAPAPTEAMLMILLDRAVWIDDGAGDVDVSFELRSADSETLGTIGVHKNLGSGDATISMDGVFKEFEA